MRVSLVNSENESLLSEKNLEYLPDSLFTFYMLTNNKNLNLTRLYTNSSFIIDFGTKDFSDNEIVLNYSWLLNFNNSKEGSYIIDYNNRFPNDTIYIKYQITEWQNSDQIIEVKLNGITQELVPIDDYYKKLVIVK